jgi:hypothetical protein
MAHTFSWGDRKAETIDLCVYDVTALATLATIDPEKGRGANKPIPVLDLFLSTEGVFYSLFISLLIKKLFVMQRVMWVGVEVGGRGWLSLTVQSTEYRMKNTEYRIQITEYRIQNSEYRIQNTEYRVQNTDFHVHKITNVPVFI